MQLNCCYCVCFFIVVNPHYFEAELALYTKRFEAVMIFMTLGMKSGSVGNLMKLLHRAHLVSV